MGQLMRQTRPQLVMAVSHLVHRQGMRHHQDMQVHQGVILGRHE